MPRAWLTPPARPSAESAAEFDDEMLRSLVEPVCRETLPAPVTVDSGAEPDSASILPSNWVTVSPMLIWLLPEAPDASNVMFWPLTVMVSPTAKADGQCVARGAARAGEHGRTGEQTANRRQRRG